MMYQDTFIVPAELWLFIIEKQERRTFMTKSSKFMEYMKLHLISLNQDKDNLNGQILATEHLLSVATDIMNETNERYE